MPTSLWTIDRPRPVPPKRRVVEESACDQVAADRGRVATIEDDEAHAVEAGEALLGADPQVTVAGLRDRQRRVLRQTIGDLPRVEHVLRGRLERAERQGGGRRERRQHGADAALPGTDPRSRES